MHEIYGRILLVSHAGIFESDYSMAPGLSQNPVPTNDLSSKIYSTVSMHLANVSRDDNLSLRTYSEVGNMNLSKKSLEVIGIVLTDERSFGKNVGSPDNRSVVLGTICLDNTAMYLDELRRNMCVELPCLPASFSFLSKEGWPIHKLHEQKVRSSHVISENNCIFIKKEFEKPRVGIVTSGGEPVGFVFTDLNVNIKQLREIMEQQLKMSQHLKLDYRFVERNGWPVMSSQEPILSLLDIMLGQIVCIQNCDRQSYSSNIDNPRPTSLMYTSNNNAIESAANTPTEGVGLEHEPLSKKKSVKTNKPDRQPSLKTLKSFKKQSKPILISYVRAEAAQYALDLKRELVSLGFSVYLDVHEIKTGSDWQDALNFAVTHCFLFVPLITHMYGKTQWTNREVKLADVLNKMIIPVNFMETWPPPCLAIQFASTQYIPWKLQESEHVKLEGEKSSDHRLWDSVSLKRVAKQIIECYRDNYYKLPQRNLSTREVVQPQLRFRSTAVNKTLLSAAKENYYVLSKDDCFDETKHLIVISAHPRQRYLAQDLKATFEKDGHEVWCSVDLLGVVANLYSEEAGADPNTPRNLPTIQEGDVFFSQNEEQFISLGDKKSLSMKEPETYGRRPLSRLMSQFSDISLPSALSHEKLDNLRTFQQKVDQAAVVVVLVSDSYTKSTFSHQQVFYCEHRKRVVLVKCDSAPIPKWFRLLMGNDMIPKVNNSQFECVLKSRVKRALNPSSSETPKDATAEAKMKYLLTFLKRNLPLQDICVYVVGSSKLQSQRSEEICRAIGTELAKVENVSLVTGGFWGAADITAKTFFDCRENNDCSKEESAVVHILPMHDSEDLTAKANQNPDGTFEAPPYGKTVFLGDSVKERETAVARLLDTCIIIEGGPGVVHEVEEFIWNDHFVIPIMSTGGAAGGQYGVPVKIFEIPPGVDTADWSVLSEKEATPDAVAKSVVNIILSLKKSLASPTCTLQKPNLQAKRKSRRKLKSRKFKPQDQDMQDIDFVVPSSTKTPIMRQVYDVRATSEISQSSSDVPSIIRRKKASWWKRFLNSLKHRN
ncbi:uncharacterized protein LOC129225728 [Uloborus diversus]|uniref:uncharacterized protein LOC129225728 n=1 Tax=Uloborus diversus TaxID=327109 RepID=UPI00240A6C08|nr:uncharacterized protein LOC129225728 [Uloborus diversus]